jgi:stage II sporulation protein M
MAKKKEGGKKRSNFLKENYALCWKFIRNSRNYIIFISLLFFAFVIIGYILPIFFTDFLKKFLQDALDKIQGMNTIQLIFYIIKNNAAASAIGILFGIFLGIPSVFTAAINGYFLGFVLSKSVAAAGPLVILKLFPHGIFELPAVLISLALGVKIGVNIITGKNKMKALAYNFKESLRVFLFIVIPLLIIAGIIEGLLIKLIQ